MTHAAAQAGEGPHGSLALIENALAYEGSLRTRTEGLTWMAWGFLLAAIFLSYDVAGPHLANATRATRVALTLLWVPWVVGGAVFTYALWRATALAAPLPSARPTGVRHTLAWLAAGALAWATVLLVFPTRGDGMLVPVLAVGSAWVLMGALAPHRFTPTGRRAVLAIGLSILAAGVTLTAAAPTPDWTNPAYQAARHWLQVARILAAALPPFVIGLGQTLRG